jgi:glycerophosphoryl diester phosphodiesterase
MLNFSCKPNPELEPKPMTEMKYNFDLQGHRGVRGLMPENSLEAFQKALDIGVNTIELDVVISRDSLVVVSHEAFMNPKFCLTPDGDTITDKSAYNLYKMNYKDIKSFDCGTLPHLDFPEQKKIKTYKPLLSEVIKLRTEQFEEMDSIPSFNIEIKSDAETDNIYHPKPEVFVDLIVEVLKTESIPDHKITLQSFDKRVVRYSLENYPHYQVAFLVYEGNLRDNLKELGKIPQIYSPLYSLLDSVQVKQAHDLGLKVIPWTVNSVDDMKELLEMGVDGIITDYPNLAKPLQKD